MAEQITLTLEDVAALCPSCAAEMITKSLSEVTLDAFAEAYVEKAKKGKGGGLGSTKDPGLFTRCMATAGARKASDPAAYCAAIHKKITGMWPGEHGGKNPTGPEKKPAKKKSATTEDALAAVYKALTQKP